MSNFIAPNNYSLSLIPLQLPHLSKWQLCPFSGSNQKLEHHSWLFCFILHLVSKSMILPSHCIQNLLCTLPTATILSHPPCSLTCIAAGASSSSAPVIYHRITSRPNTQWHWTTIILLCSWILLVRSTERDPVGTAPSYSHDILGPG